MARMSVMEEENDKPFFNPLFGFVVSLDKRWASSKKNL
jgi:hypothetical protein